MPKPMKLSRTVYMTPHSTMAAMLSLAEPVHLMGTWAADEHDRFLDAMRLYPKGPWKDIADHVVTRSVRQVQTHAQKYQEKIVRHQRGLRKPQRKKVADENEVLIGHRVVMGTYGKLRKRKLDDQESHCDDPLRINKGSSESEPNDGGDSDASSASAKMMGQLAVSPLVKCIQRPTVSVSSRVVACSPMSVDCAEPAPMSLQELDSEWHDDGDFGVKTTYSFLNEPECPSGLPSLGESLDFLIEYLDHHVLDGRKPYASR